MLHLLMFLFLYIPRSECMFFLHGDITFKMISLLCVSYINCAVLQIKCSASVWSIFLHLHCSSALARTVWFSGSRFTLLSCSGNEVINEIKSLRICSFLVHHSEFPLLQQGRCEKMEQSLCSFLTFAPHQQC